MKNAYEKLNGPAEKQEARDLTMMFLLAGKTESFERIWKLMAEAAEFLKEKQAIRDAEDKDYWESEEGKARHKEIVERFSKRSESSE
jgi:hypothetical protein